MLFMPSAIGLALIVAGLWMLWRATRQPEQHRPARRGLTIAGCGTLLIYLASTPLVATWLAWSLECQTPFLPIERLPTCGAIVVLAGGQAGFLDPAGETHRFTQRAGDRLDRGVAAFKAGKAPLMVMGGGSLSLPGEPLVGDFLREQAEARGVPHEAILRCGKARYTTDEGAEIVGLLRERGVSEILLCTSASHMPRARRVYEALGMKVHPVPADYDTRGSAESFSLALLLPRGLALAETEGCLKEWLGLVAGWLFGFR